jgi:MFS family permease
MRNRLALASYFVSACLARSADAGAIVGIVLLANHVAPHTATAGLLAACLTAPHLAGPFAARLLDRARRKTLLLSSAFVLYACALAGSGLLLASHRAILAAITLVLAGACGPLVTGGLSSLLAGLVTAQESAQRRAQGMDALTYGVAGTTGPAVIAIVAASAGPLLAILVAAGLAVAAALALLALAAQANARPEDSAAPVLTVRESIAVLLRSPSLRRVTLTTALAAMPIGAISLLALAFALDHGGQAIQGAELVTADGVGGLVGSAIAIIRPLRGDPERLTLWWTVAIGVGFALCAASPSIVLALVAFGVTGVLTSIQFAATLAARSAYSPPGGRAQIFVTMAGLKVAFSSLGVAIVGLAHGVSSVWLLIGAAVLALAGAAYMAADGRRVSRSRSQ